MSEFESERETFNSMKQLAETKDIPLHILKMAKVANAPGFNSNNSVNYSLLAPWLLENQEQLEANYHDTLEHYKKEIAKRDVVIRDLEIKKRKGEALDPEEVKSFLAKVATIQSALLTARFVHDLPPKTTGLSIGEIKELNKNAVIEICNVFSKELAQWK
jgi:hypothetical protein